MTIISSLFLILNHPISLGFTLLIQIAFISSNVKFNNSNPWFSYILFIIMIGGLMIIFIYMTSISSNKKFVINKKSILMLTIFIPLSILIKDKSEIINNKPIDSFIKYTYSNENLIMIFMISYIFIALIAVSNLTKMNQGPLRKI